MDRKAIGQTLAELRGDRSQVEVAATLGISPAALSMYECGERIPRDDIKIKLSDYYGVPVHAIFFASDTHET